MKPAVILTLALTTIAIFPFVRTSDAASVTSNALVNEIAIAHADPALSLEFLVHLPLRRTTELDALIENQTTRSSPLYHHFLTPAQFRATYGPAPDVTARATSMLAAYGLTVHHTTSQFLEVRGTVAAIDRAFATEMSIQRSRTGKLTVATRIPLSVPRDLASLGATVHGLYQLIEPHSNARPAPLSIYGRYGAYWFDDLKQAYSYPAYGTYIGRGVSIAIVGNSDFSDSDAMMFFNHEKLGSSTGDLAPAPVPQHYNFAGSQPFDYRNRDSFEANLDVQQANGSAPGATVTNIAVPVGSGEGFLYAYSFLDDVNFASIVSTSYGGCELAYTSAYNSGRDLTGSLRAYHDLFLEGNAQGITFIFSSGDRGGRECPPPSYYNRGPGLRLASVPSVQYWANDPNVTAVGGTDLATSYTQGSRKSTYLYETAYADPLLPEDPDGTGNLLMHDVFGSGGGESVIWPKPKYQQLVNTHTAGRAVPDLAMQMGSCPGGSVQPCHPGASVTIEAFGGALVGAVGTSVAAPEFAGLLAIEAQAQGGVRFGNINPLIYDLGRNNGSLATPFYHQYIPGNNSVVNDNAAVSYNLITGVGTPIARNWLLLPFAPLAGDPETGSNP